MTEGKFYKEFIVAPPVTYLRLYNNLKAFYAGAKRDLREIDTIKNSATQRLAFISWTTRWFGND